MNRKKLLVLILFIMSSAPNAFCAGQINASVRHNYVMEINQTIYAPPIFVKKLPNLNADFVNLSYMFRYKPIQMLGDCELFYKKKKNTNLTPASPMNNTPSVYHVSLNQNKPAVSYTDKADSWAELIKNNPNRPEFIYSYALHLKNEKKLTDALTQVNKALSINPEYALGYFLKGDILRALGKHKEAVIAYLYATELNPYCTDAYFNIAKIMEIYSQPELALDYYKMAYSTSPNDMEIRNIIQKLQ